MILQKTKIHLAFAVVAVFSLAACTQTTPSMMNVSQVELAHETTVEQIAIDQLTQVNLNALAAQYQQQGHGSMDLTMTYDPTSRSFTAMKAVNELKRVEAILRKQGVKNIITQTMAVPDGRESLIVSYDTVRAQAPSDCSPMPGLTHNETGRFLGDYKFGCGVETMFAKQIARPSDLEGNSEMDIRSGRRDSIVVEGYSAGVPREPLDGIERDDLAAGN